MFHLDCFSIGLDELPKHIAGNKLFVLKKITRAGRFSCFEASANDTIANVITELLAGNLVETYVPDQFKNRRDETGLPLPDQNTFPWTYVRLTAAGK